MINIKYSSSQEKRRIIKAMFIKAFNINDFNTLEIISEEKVLYLIDKYDELFFNDYIKYKIRNPLTISFSNRMTSSGGKTIYTKTTLGKSYEIRLSTRVIGTFVNDRQAKTICGIKAEDLLEGLMLILEHELCHVLEFAVYGNSNCKGKRFKEMAKRLYDHTSSYHEILKSNKINNEILDMEVGKRVYFIYNSKEYEGLISNVNKRATVMVKDIKGSYRDKEGNRYSKWYVPLSRLRIKECYND